MTRATPASAAFSTDRAGPLYQQIAAYFEGRIVRGELTPGTRLPSERVLAEELDVNRSTVIAAYRELMSAGLVEGRGRSGTYVTLRSEAAGTVDPRWDRYTQRSPFLANMPLLTRVRAASRDGDAIDFSADLAEDLFPNAELAQIMAKSKFECSLGYADPRGFEPLREVVAAHLRDRLGMDVGPASVLITAGAQQALFLIVQTLLRPRDVIAVERPSYFLSLPFFRSAGLRVVTLPVDDQGVRPADVAAEHRVRPIRMLFTNPTFQNPTGSRLPTARREQLLDTCSALGIPLVEDDPFALLSSSGTGPLPIKAMDGNGIVLYAGSLSKVVSSSLRIGWLVGPEEVIERIADARQQTQYGVSVLAEWVASNLLASDFFPAHLDSLRRALQRRKETLSTALEYLLGDQLSFVVPDGGIHLWCAVREPIDDAKLFLEGVRQKVVVTPGGVYGAGPGHLRLTYARPRLSELEIGAERIAATIASMQSL